MNFKQRPKGKSQGQGLYDIFEERSLYLQLDYYLLLYCFKLRQRLQKIVGAAVNDIFVIHKCIYIQTTVFSLVTQLSRRLSKML